MNELDEILGLDEDEQLIVLPGHRSKKHDPDVDYYGCDFGEDDCDDENWLKEW